MSVDQVKRLYESMPGKLDQARRRFGRPLTLAEKILVSDVGGVFIYHRTVADLYKPYLKGTELEPDKNGFAAMHWPTFGNPSTLVGSIYVSKDVANSGRKIP